jgi:hypothetical protein
MGVTYKPEDARRRRLIERAMEDLDPSLREPARRLIEGYNGVDLEKKLTDLIGYEKMRHLIERK